MKEIILPYEAAGYQVHAFMGQNHPTAKIIKVTITGGRQRDRKTKILFV